MDKGEVQHHRVWILEFAKISLVLPGRFHFCLSLSWNRVVPLSTVHLWAISANMGRELQKRKNRSSIAKVRHKPKSKKNILNNAVISANWDRNQTLAQNYKRLGLSAKLNKTTGGVERKVGDVEREKEQDGKAPANGLMISGGNGRGKKEQLDLGEEKVERDPVTGKILRVVSTGNTARPNPLNDRLNDLDSDYESNAEMFDQHGHGKQQDQPSQPKTAVVAELEQRASLPEKKYRRQQSEGERVFVEALVGKYGEDYERMARDTQINYMQRSAGDLKKRVKKWRESVGRVG